MKKLKTFFVGLFAFLEHLTRPDGNTEKRKSLCEYDENDRYDYSYRRNQKPNSLYNDDEY